LFTKAAVLEEPINSAYFRFNDDTFSDLQPNLRPPEDAEDFARRWSAAALNLAEWDALRLFMTFSCYLPSSDAGPSKCSAGATDLSDQGGSESTNHPEGGCSCPGRGHARRHAGAIF